MRKPPNSGLDLGSGPGLCHHGCDILAAGNPLPSFGNTSAPDCITQLLFHGDRAGPWLTWVEKAGI